VNPRPAWGGSPEGKSHGPKEDWAGDLQGRRSREGIKDAPLPQRGEIIKGSKRGASRTKREKSLFPESGGDFLSIGENLY